MRYELLFPGEYLREADLRGNEAVVTIESIAMETLRMTGGGQAQKPVIRLKGTEKKLVLNKTNAKAIAAQLGKDTDDWIGKKIRLIPAKDRFGKEMVDCIRIGKVVKNERRAESSVVAGEHCGTEADNSKNGDGDPEIRPSDERESEGWKRVDRTGDVA